MFRWSTVVGRSVLAPAVALAVATAAALPATNPSSRSTPMPAPPSFPVDRDPYGWPLRQDSIWNLPIADEARYVAAGIQPATERGMTVDEDIIVLAPDAPPTDVYTNFKGWSDRSAGARCVAEGPKLASLPIPPDWTYGHDEGSTPNASAAILQPDGETLFQTQPFHRCRPARTRRRSTSSPR